MNPNQIDTTELYMYFCFKFLEITAREEMSDRYFEIPNLIGEDTGPYRYDQDFLMSEVSFLYLHIKQKSCYF